MDDLVKPIRKTSYSTIGKNNFVKQDHPKKSYGGDLLLYNC